MVTEEHKARINVRRLLEFFDEKAPGSAGHASAIVAVCGEDLGMGLLRHHFESQGACVDVDRRCTQGTPSGVRLDGWLRVTSGERDTLYQVEIKNWSAHAIGGRPLRIDAPPEVVAKYKMACWTQQWDDATGVRKKALAKVLTPMAPPKHLSHISSIEPLACMWTALHPCEELAPLFSVAVPQPRCFRRLWFFSMSAYLRSLEEEWIMIEMLDTARRLKWLGELITTNDANA